MAAYHFLKYMLPPKWRLALNERIVSFSTRHHFGSKAVQLPNNEAAVTCLVKNGEFYIEQFIQHYFEMGFRHIIFLDNGSTDKTVSIAKRHRNVSVYESRINVGRYQCMLKQFMARKFITGGWCLDVDIDEFFDYPCSDSVNLIQFLGYLNRHKYTAVVTQMLDMFSGEPLSYLAKSQDEDMKATYKYYDITAIEKSPYRQSDISFKYARDNELSDDNIKLHIGGIRKTLYGLNCLLSKHSLFSRQENVELSHVHFVNKARIADLSCVLLHFKLTSTAFETALQNKDSFSGTSQGYADFINVLKSQPDYEIKQDSALEFRNVNDLLTDGFLVVSDSYRKYANG